MRVVMRPPMHPHCLKGENDRRREEKETIQKVETNLVKRAEVQNRLRR